MHGGASEGKRTLPDLVSVIVPCLNPGDLLLQQTRALRDQVYSGDWELIFVDNGSTDGSIQRAVELCFAAGFKPRVIYAGERKGKSYAVNVGAELAHGDLLLIADADDVVERHWIKKLVEASSEYDLCEAQACRALDAVTGHFASGAISGDPAPSQGPGLTGVFAVWRDLHFRIGGFDEDMLTAEDQDYVFRARTSGARIGRTNALFYYRPRAGLMSSLKQQHRFGIGDVRLHQKHGRAAIDRRTARQALSSSAYWLLKTPQALLDPTIARSWVRNLGRSSGRLRGSYHYRHWFP